MRRSKLRYRTLAEISRGRVRFALTLTHRFWRLRAHPYIVEIRRWPERRVVPFADCYTNLRLAALRAAARFRYHLHHDLSRYIWYALRMAFLVELRKSSWWLDDDGLARLKAHEIAGSSPTADLLVPVPLTDVVDERMDRRTQVVDGVPDREAVPVPDLVCRRIQAAQVRALIARLPTAQRRPTWMVFALGIDAYTSSKHLGISLKNCHKRAYDGLARLQKMVAENPEFLLPLDGD